MENTPRGAILQRDKKTWAIVPRTPVGIVTPETLEKMAAVVRQYGVPVTKITSGQRLALVGIEAADVDRIWHDLGMEVGPAIELCVHYVQACPGNAVCKFGLRDSLGLGMELEKLYVGKELPAKLKMGISGCPFCCGESWVRDIGVIGRNKGWTVVVGGNSAGRPRIGDLLAADLEREEVVALADRFMLYYRDRANKRERTARFVERLTIDKIREDLR